MDVVVAVESSTELLTHLSDVTREVKLVDASQDNVVDLHGIGCGEWGSNRRKTTTRSNLSTILDPQNNIR